MIVMHSVHQLPWKLLCTLTFTDLEVTDVWLMHPKLHPLMLFLSFILPDLTLRMLEQYCFPIFLDDVFTS